MLCLLHGRIGSANTITVTVTFLTAEERREDDRVGSLRLSENSTVDARRCFLVASKHSEILCERPVRGRHWRSTSVEARSQCRLTQYLGLAHLNLDCVCPGCRNEVCSAASTGVAAMRWNGSVLAVERSHFS